MSAKEYAIRTNCSEAELTKMSSEGWGIQFMQFMPDTKLHVVFCRDVAPAAKPVESVTVVTAPAKTIPNKPLLKGVVIGLDEQPRSVPLTYNTRRAGDTRPVNMPTGDAVTQEAMRVGRETYNRVVAEGQAKINQARPHFMGVKP